MPLIVSCLQCQVIRHALTWFSVIVDLTALVASINVIFHGWVPPGILPEYDSPLNLTYHDRCYQMSWESILNVKVKIVSDVHKMNNGKDKHMNWETSRFVRNIILKLDVKR